MLSPQSFQQPAGEGRVVCCFNIKPQTSFVTVRKSMPFKIEIARHEIVMLPGSFRSFFTAPKLRNKLFDWFNDGYRQFIPRRVGFQQQG